VTLSGVVVPAIVRTAPPILLLHHATSLHEEKGCFSHQVLLGRSSSSGSICLQSPFQLTLGKTSSDNSTIVRHQLIEFYSAKCGLSPDRQEMSK